MNRAIEFRAWDKVNKLMVKVWGANWKDFDGEQLLSFIAVNPVINGEYILKIENAELIQYTGLKDKKGIKIYEGDIRQFKKGIGIIVWEDAAFAIKSPGSEAVDWEHSSVLIDSDYLGNIYEHPTLIDTLAQTDTSEA